MEAITQLGGPLKRFAQGKRVTSAPGGASSRLGLATLAAVLVVVLSFSYSGFFTTSNGLSIGLSMSSIAIAAIGSAALLISGNVDLSIGSMYALIAVLVGEVAASTQGVILPILVGLTLGVAFGAINGGLVRILNISPIIVTIGMLAVYRGMAYVISGGLSVYGFSHSFTQIGQGGFGQLTIPIMVAVVVFVIGGFLLVRTRRGLHVYAVGGDARAAELNGIPVHRTVFGLYVLNGVLVGIVATLAAARLGSASPSLGTGFELDVLTAALLGGVAFAGGSGRPIGVLIGVATIGIVNAGLVFAGVATYWQEVAKGSLLLLALLADQVTKYRRERAARRAAPSVSTRISAGARDPGGEAEPEPRRTAAELETAEVRLETDGIGRRYGAVQALADASMKVRAGEIVCLVGDNGAGKSTLIKALSGAASPDEGSISLEGVPIKLSSPHDARKHGIETVYQDLAVCPNLSVAHNLVLGNEPSRRLAGILPVRDDGAAREIASERLDTLGIHLPHHDVLVESLSGGQRQCVAIARVIHGGVKVLILDEPTAALGVTQTGAVLRLVKRVAARGTGVVFISHDVRTVFEIADRVVVLRLGRIVFEGRVDSLTESELMDLMSGISGAAAYEKATS